MVCEREEYDRVDCGKTYRVRKQNESQCKLKTSKEILEEVDEFKCLAAVLCKNGMETETRQYCRGEGK